MVKILRTANASKRNKVVLRLQRLRIFCCILISTSLKIPPDGSIENKEPLVRVMACPLFNVKLLPEPMMAESNDAYKCHQSSMN